MYEPVLISILFADRIIIEDNGKKGLIGVFSNFMSPSFPIAFPPWAIYIAVTNIKGDFQFALNLVHSENNQVVIPISGNLTSSDSSEVLEMTFNINGAVFPSEGIYNLNFHLGKELLGSRILKVVKMENPEETIK